MGFDDLLQLPTRVRRLIEMAEKTDAAITELQSSVDEVAGELETLVNTASNLDGDTASKLGDISARLRGLQPDTAPTAPPAEPA